MLMDMTQPTQVIPGTFKVMLSITTPLILLILLELFLRNRATSGEGAGQRTLDWRRSK